MGSLKNLCRIFSNKCSQYRYFILISILGVVVLFMINVFENATDGPETHFRMPNQRSKYRKIGKRYHDPDIDEDLENAFVDTMDRGVPGFQSRLREITQPNLQYEDEASLNPSKLRRHQKGRKRTPERKMKTLKRNKRNKHRTKLKSKPVRDKIKQGRHGSPVSQDPNAIPRYLSVGQKLGRKLHVNVTASDALPLNRGAPDVQPPECRNISYDTARLPNMSVIISFYNEVNHSAVYTR